MLRQAFASPKLPHLQSLLGGPDGPPLPRYQAVGLLESIWFFTGTQAPRGDIGKWTNSQIAAAIGYEGSADFLVSCLVESLWIDECAANRLLVHDWSKHCGQIVSRAPQVKSEGFATRSLATDSVNSSSIASDSPHSLSLSSEPESGSESDRDQRIAIEESGISAPALTALYSDHEYLESLCDLALDGNAVHAIGLDSGDAWYWLASVLPKMQAHRIRGKPLRDLRAAGRTWIKRAKQHELISARDDGVAGKFDDLIPEEYR